ncbi:hypothetical protein [Streptomyces sp. NPDC047718]|uniref:hypothetical protein n=1 Tax=Streptomyces sp. NPDC047718 TaxID=3155479 RepID=UPI0033D180A2
MSALIHRAFVDGATRVWAPVLAIFEADREHPGLAEHVGQLDVIHTIDLDYAAMLSVAQLCREGASAGIAAAVSAVRNFPDWGVDALVATIEPTMYERHGVGVLDLRR